MTLSEAPNLRKPPQGGQPTQQQEYDAYYRERGFQPPEWERHDQLEKIFNLKWASAWSGVDLLAGSGKEALDAGCGAGANTRLLHSLGYRATGADVSSVVLKEAASRSERAGCGSIRWLAASLDEDSLSGSYDLIICWEVIEHLRQPVKALENMFRSLRPGGVMIVATPNLLSLSHLLLRRDPTHIHVHSSFWWSRQLRRLHPCRHICRSMMFWDHVLPFLRNPRHAVVTPLPWFGFRIRMAVQKTP